MKPPLLIALVVGCTSGCSKAPTTIESSDVPVQVTTIEQSQPSSAATNLGNFEIVIGSRKEIDLGNGKKCVLYPSALPDGTISCEVSAFDQDGERLETSVERIKAQSAQQIGFEIDGTLYLMTLTTT